MSEILMIKAANGALVPLDDEQAQKLKRFKVGSVVRGEFVEMRNGKFFRKWWTLANFAFDLWAESMEPMEYRGQRVQPVFEKFRKDLTILAGFYHPVFNIDGSFKVEADSIAWAKMNEETFAVLYSKTIDAILAKVLPRHGLSHETLANHVDRVLEFA
jgi:hypothetical protein